MDRVILHSDMNSFYASVEIMLNPELRNKPVAVGGSTEERHGIILTKNQIAKKYGIKTGMVNWEAKLLCPDLVIITHIMNSISNIQKWHEKYTVDIQIKLNRLVWMNVGLI